jgi:hypothetical protein
MKGSEMKVIFTTMDASWESDFKKKNKTNKGIWVLWKVAMAIGGGTMTTMAIVANALMNDCRNYVCYL